MNRNDGIGIVGIITEQPHLILDTTNWAGRVYETKLERMRPSGTIDEFILRFSGRAAGSEEEMERLAAGVEVLIAGEIQTENASDPKPEESRVVIYICADVIKVNDPPAEQQNEVRLCGNICKEPRRRATRKDRKQQRQVAVTDMIVAVKSTAGTQYIPCVCWSEIAEVAATLPVGAYVEITGRFQSRNYRKHIAGKDVPFLMTAYEVSVIEMGYEDTENEERGAENE